MKNFAALAITVLTMTAWTLPAHADTREANCEVRKDGEKKKGKSGPCTFAQRQGYIDIGLANGEALNLRPANEANRYRDARGNKVVRTDSSGNSQEFKWEGGMKVIVTFTGNSGGQHGSGNYSTNRLANGGIEVMWAKQDCYATFNKHANPVSFSKGCDQKHRERAQEIARSEL